MTSPLDNRIRAVVSEALTEQSGTGGVDAASLQQQITDLHEHLHYAATTVKRLGDRVLALEEAAGLQAQGEAALARRTRRKTAGE